MPVREDFACKIQAIDTSIYTKLDWGFHISYLVFIRKLHNVILRSPAKGGTTKNLMVRAAAEILRGAYPFDRTCRRAQVVSLRAGSELVGGLRMTLGSFRMDTS